jgi:hypothetical protein
MEGKYTQDLIEIPREEYRELIERYVAAETKLEAAEKKWLDLYSRNKSLEEKNRKLEAAEKGWYDLSSKNKSLEEKNRKLEEMLNGKHES